MSNIKICCDEMKKYCNEYFEKDAEFKNNHGGSGTCYLSYSFINLEDSIILSFNDGWNFLTDICFKYCPNCGTKIE